MLLFDRRCQLITADGTEYNSWDGVMFSFSYSTINETGVPTAEIEILNLDRTLRDNFKEQGAIFNIGYGDYLGTLISGDINNLEIDNKVTFDVTGNNTNRSVYAQWYNTNTREDFIVKDIAQNAGMKILGAELLADYSRVNGYSVKGNAINSIQAICDNRGLGVTFKGDLVKIYKIAGELEQHIILDDTSGLTNVVKYNKKGEKAEQYDFIVKALPIPTLIQGMIVELHHDVFTGNATVVDFSIRGGRNWKAEYFVKIVK